MKASITVFLAGLCLLAFSAMAQDADFGDLPDGVAGGNFPTLKNSTNAAAGRTGPYHLDVSHEWIGVVPGGTTTEPDAQMVDLDLDDGAIDFTFSNIYESAAFLQAGQVTVPVTTDGDSAVRYLNIAADLNGDGRFQSYSTGSLTQWEWLGCNMPVIHQNETKAIVARFYLDQQVATVPWVRVTLTTVPINPADFGANGWDGSGPVGGFARGETEDYGPGALATSYQWSIGGAFMPPPTVPVMRHGPGNPPLRPPNTPYQRPGAQAPVKWNPPAQPAGPEPAPVTTEPPRAGQDIDAPAGRGDVSLAPGMPDIKQGENECVPTATANSLRYLMDSNGTTPEGMNPAESDDFNDQLRESLKTAMGTDPANGTAIDPEHPEECKFLQGKEAANQLPGINGRLTTSPRPNPSVDEICNAVNAGKDVEIVLYSYPAGQENPPRDPMGHMVTVTGCVRHADGTVELKFHDPDDKGPLDAPGDTVYPPREHSIIVENAADDSSEGGLRIKVHGVPDGYKKEKVYYIEAAFIEEFADQGDLGAHAECSPGYPAEGHTVTLTAGVGSKAEGYYYQWIFDGMDLPDAYADTYVIPALTPELCGTYECWVYNGAGTYQYTQSVDVDIYEEPPVPVGGAVGLGLLATGIAAAGFLAIRRRKK